MEVVSIAVTVLLGGAAIGVTWYLSNKAAQDLTEIKILSETMNQLSLKLIDKALDVTKIHAQTFYEMVKQQSMAKLGEKAKDKEIEKVVDTVASVATLRATGALPLAGTNLAGDISVTYPDPQKSAAERKSNDQDDKPPGIEIHKQ